VAGILGCIQSSGPHIQPYSTRPQFQPSILSGTFCCHPDAIWPRSVSTKHSIGHNLLSSRRDLAPFSFNQAWNRTHFVLIQIQSGPGQFQPNMMWAPSRAVWFRQWSVCSPFVDGLVPTVVVLRASGLRPCPAGGRFGSDCNPFAGGLVSVVALSVPFPSFHFLPFLPFPSLPSLPFPSFPFLPFPSLPFPSLPSLRL
jgi:hypothetical protein